MENPFEEFANEEIFINAPDGTRTGPVKASFDHTTFTVWLDDLDVEKGCTIDRPITPKKSERYKVARVKFNKAVDDVEMPASWDIVVESDAKTVDTPKTVTNNITINHSSGFQIGDHNTQTIEDGIKTLINEIEKSGASAADKKSLKGKLADVLRHPLTVSLVGAGAGVLADKLKS